ncbi:MAG TPA: Stp1/IreP family PP2C-type Ser/Thr phosphatase [Thermoanaerobaculia bacterium]|nr:Stp1/IreP family PP2C-type Ser/Thr phosphatase [Thermoanaerobaculia bacterium]
MTDHPAAEDPAVASGRLVVRAVLRTDVGLVRAENQDFGLYTTRAEESESHTGGRLMLVADGMGGHRGGATASRLAAQTVKAQYLGSETNDIPSALRDSLTRANARVYSEAQSNPELRGMGTTTSALVIRDGKGWFGHVGDSRIYLVRDSTIQQLTDDHSLVATMVREGLLTSKEAEVHPRRNVLQRSVGVTEEVEVDVRGPIDVRIGDTFILCSDGLHGVVKEDELKEIAKLPIVVAADLFVKRALERGAPDNVTVIVARVVSSEDDEVEYDPYLDETQPYAPFDDTAPTDYSAHGEGAVKPTEHIVDTVPAEAPKPEHPASESVQTSGTTYDDTMPIAPPIESTAPLANIPAPAQKSLFDDTAKVAALTAPLPKTSRDDTAPVAALTESLAKPPADPFDDTRPSKPRGALTDAPAKNDAPIPESEKSTDKVPALRSPLPASSSAEQASASPAAETSAPAAPAPKAAAATPTPPPRQGRTTPVSPLKPPIPEPRNPLLKWMLITALTLGAAGAIFFWSQQHGAASSQMRR